MQSRDHNKEPVAEKLEEWTEWQWRIQAGGAGGARPPLGNQETWKSVTTKLKMCFNNVELRNFYEFGNAAMLLFSHCDASNNATLPTPATCHNKCRLQKQRSKHNCIFYLVVFSRSRGGTGGSLVLCLRFA